jgi:hypothetical protein
MLHFLQAEPDLRPSTYRRGATGARSQSALVECLYAPRHCQITLPSAGRHVVLG